ncbi:MAG: VacJ family lipoprotein [Gammaproteobacteria bacterium]|nr:MAG: VacJ family lipoprotein [Gammaproteobacteria bacterium]
MLLATTLGAQAARYDERDPYEAFNRGVFAFNEFLDEWALRPAAQAYRFVTPDFVDSGITNFFNNLRRIPTLGNQILQLKVTPAAETATSFIFDTFFGLGGFVDWSHRWGLRDQKEDFGQTLVHWGLPDGPYLMLPLLGPRTVSDAVGIIPDSFWTRDLYSDVHGDTQLIAQTVNVVDRRADVIPAERFIQGDKYIFLRNAYLERREFDIHDGLMLDDPFAGDDLDDF